MDFDEVLKKFRLTSTKIDCSTQCSSKIDYYSIPIRFPIQLLRGNMGIRYRVSSICKVQSKNYYFRNKSTDINQRFDHEIMHVLGFANKFPFCQRTILKSPEKTRRNRIRNRWRAKLIIAVQEYLEKYNFKNNILNSGVRYTTIICRDRFINALIQKVNL